MRAASIPLDLSALAWPQDRLGEALEMLTRHQGFGPVPGTVRGTLSGPPPAPQPEVFEDWMAGAAENLRLEIEPEAVTHARVHEALRTIDVCIIPLPGADGPRFLAVLGRRKLRLLAPSRSPRTVSRDDLARALQHDIEAPRLDELQDLVRSCGLSHSRQKRAARALVDSHLAETPVGVWWHLRPSPQTPLWRLARTDGLVRKIGVMVGAYLAQHLLWILAWFLIARTALQGRPDSGWFMAWCLVLLTLVPLRAVVTWTEGLLAAGFGGLLKQRLLDAALRLPIEDTRRQGIGQFLGRVLESEAVESLALSGGILGLLSLIEIVVAGVVLAMGAAAWAQVGCLLIWTGLSAWAAWSYLRSRRAWSSGRVALTNDSVERMVGHKTRLVQEAPERRHEEEDQALSRYLESSRLMDRSASWVLAGVPRGWIVLGLLGLVPTFMSGTASPEGLAISLGGILLALQAFEKFAAGAWHLAGAAAAWEQIAPLYHAGAARSHAAPLTRCEPARPDARRDERRSATVLQADDVVYRHRPGAEPILRGSKVRIAEGDRWLLEGPSGSGKSTFAALLAGLRRPDSGLILSRGLDLPSLGPVEWRRRVALSPQFHENYVFTETLAFNLLMGRGWPPRREDLEEAESVCRELGLGPLLQKMPSGLFQMVGESGWQLSHGELSRLFIARALLQNADLVVLDESLGAMDPESQRRGLACVTRRANSLLLIAQM